MGLGAARSGIRFTVISPHLDDVVLSCGQLLAAHPASRVVTVFAGRPARYPQLTSWDARCGFKPGEDVVGIRRAEDLRALTILRAKPIWLSFVETQYGPPPTVEALAAAIEQALDTSTNAVAIPLGLFHHDHQLTHAAAVTVLETRPNLDWFAYEESIYRRMPDTLDGRLAELEQAGFDLRPADCTADTGLDLKRRAVECYRSQLRALATSWPNGYADIYEPERYWSLRPTSTPLTIEPKSRAVGQVARP